MNKSNKPLSKKAHVPIKESVGLWNLKNKFVQKQTPTLRIPVRTFGNRGGK